MDFVGNAYGLQNFKKQKILNNFDDMNAFPSQYAVGKGEFEWMEMFPEDFLPGGNKTLQCIF